jgi:signal transduction histidine kinase
LKSLRARLSVGLAASLVLLLALQWAVAGVVIGQLVENQLLGRLDQDAESLLSGIDPTAESGFNLDPARVSAVYQRPFSGHYYVIMAAGRTEASRSLWDSRILVPELNPGAQAVLRQPGPEKQPLLVAAHGYQKQGQAIVIAVAQDLTEVNAGLRRFQLIHAIISFAILLALLGFQYLIVTHGLRPLHRVRQDMQRLANGEIEQISTQGPQEILPLISELNRLLAVMRQKTQRSREAMGNLAHALKTQLALLSQATEQQDTALHPELQSQLREVGEDMRNVIERELRRARLLGASIPGKRLDLEQATSRLVHALQHMYADKAPTIDCNVRADIALAIDEEDMLELLGNLLDNACKWCRKQVRLNVSGEDGLRLRVEDDGPGCAPEQVEALTRRGFRLDESKPGSGLGLAIVRDIVDSYGGTMTFGASADLRGLLVDVRLPIAQHK